MLGQVRELFMGQALRDLEAQTSPKALDTYVVLTNKMRDRTVAGFRFDPVQPDRYGIVLNARYLFDPEQVAFVLAEETVHAQQYFDGVDFDAQDAQHLYEDRPYEIDAKQKATYVLGYGYADIPHWKLRPEPVGLRKPIVPYLIGKKSRKRNQRKRER
jgi:hypothetical protein